MAGMGFRKLRIAWSVVWLAISILVCGLWVRSYRYADLVFGKVPVAQELISVRGRLKITKLAPSGVYTGGETRFPIDGRQAIVIESHVMQFANSLGFGVYNAHSLLFPHWFAAVVAALMAVPPWLRWRFGVRTLLASTAVVAAMLGFLCWAFSR
jgi:hypothetical protein